MKIFLFNHDYKYPLEQIIRLFYPYERLEYTSDTEYGYNEIIALIAFRDLSDRISVTAQINEYGNIKNATAEVEKYWYVTDDKEFDKICKDLVKQAFFIAAQKIRKINVPWGILTGIRPAKIVREYIEKGKSSEEIVKILSDRYLVSDSKIKLAMEVAENELNILKNSNNNNISIYIGIPFCPSRCLYCSFVSHSVHRAYKFVESYIEALIKEITKAAKIINDMDWKIENIYIGGGTPTVLSAPQLDKLLYNVSVAFSLDSLKEFTVEAGRPDTIDKKKLNTIKEYGVNRLSINPQTMNSNILKLIGRMHTPEDIICAYNMARESGFNNINMDVIAGLPEESLEMYCESLKRIQRLNPENITVHTMSIKRASRLKQEISGYTLAQADTVQKMLSFTEAFMKENNMKPYYLYRQKNILGNLENVGYSKDKYEGIYNVQIMEEQQTIIALGCGGVTKLVDLKKQRIDRIFNVKEVEDYIGRIDEMLERKNLIYKYFS